MEPVPVSCHIPELLRKLNKEQQWLADITGKSRQKISDYCHMRIPMMNLRTAKLFAHHLQCNIDDLYEWEWQ